MEHLCSVRTGHGSETTSAVLSLCLFPHPVLFCLFLSPMCHFLLSFKVVLCDCLDIWSYSSDSSTLWHSPVYNLYNLLLCLHQSATCLSRSLNHYSSPSIWCGRLKCMRDKCDKNRSKDLLTIQKDAHRYKHSSCFHLMLYSSLLFDHPKWIRAEERRTDKNEQMKWMSSGRTDHQTGSKVSHDATDTLSKGRIFS